MYVIALVIQFLKWAHFPLNSQRLPRYDPSKMGHFSAFWGICIGKSSKFGTKIQSVSTFSSHWVVQRTPFMVLLEDMRNIYETTGGILEKMIFSHFLAVFVPKFCRFSSFQENFGPKMAKKRLKIIFSKIPPVVLQIFLISSNKTINGVLWTTQWLEKVLTD